MIDSQWNPNGFPFVDVRETPDITTEPKCYDLTNLLVRTAKRASTHCLGSEDINIITTMSYH